MQKPNTVESILLAELNLRLPPLSFYKLVKEPSDWSFILKLHAILEGALTRLLERRLSESDFDETLTFMRKVQLAFELRELAHDNHYRSFLVTLNHLRNRFAHRAEYIVADIPTVIQGIPTHKRSSVLQSLAVGIKIPGTTEDDPRNRIGREEMTRKWPRYMIMMSAGYALDMLSLAYYFQMGKDGEFYFEEYRSKLQDLLHDPEVIELRRKIEAEFPDDDSADAGDA